jgi:hypothetical protein
MLFTWSSENLCIVFPQWRVTGTLSLLISLVAIVLLTAGYEWVRDMSRRYEQSHSAHMQAFATTTQRTSVPVYYIRGIGSKLKVLSHQPKDPESVK